MTDIFETLRMIRQGSLATDTMVFATKNRYKMKAVNVVHESPPNELVTFRPLFHSSTILSWLTV